MIARHTEVPVGSISVSKAPKSVVGNRKPTLFAANYGRWSGGTESLREAQGWPSGDPRPLPHRRLQLPIGEVCIQHGRAQVGVTEGLLHEPDVLRLGVEICGE